MQSLTNEIAGTEIDVFAGLFFPHYLKQETPDFHREIYDLLQSDIQRLAIAAPRGHAKSTIVALIYLLWVALTDRKRFIVILSETATQSDLLLDAVRHELESNDLLIRHYGDQAGSKKWTQSEIVLNNGVKIFARGAGSSIRGLREKEQRPDLVIVDDLENDEHITSKMQREKLKSWYSRVVENIGDPDTCRIITIGTILHPYALLKELLDDDKWPGYTKRKYHAIKDGVSLFPDRFSIEKLNEIRRDIGSFAFQCEYMNDPVDAKTKTFQLEWIKYHDLLDIEHLTIYGAIDPAISTKASADYFACVTIGVDDNSGDIYILDIYRERASLDKHIQAVFELYRRYNWMVLGIEQVAFQEAFRQMLDDESARQKLYIPTRGIKNHTDKLLRIQKLQPLFEQGRIHVRRDMTEFMEEYDLYPKVDHDDQLDALEMAVRLVGGGRIQLGSF